MLSTPCILREVLEDHNLKRRQNTLRLRKMSAAVRITTTEDAELVVAFGSCAGLLKPQLKKPALKG